MKIGNLIGSMAAGSLGAVLVKEFVTAANLSGSAGTIAGLFTFVLVGGIALAGLSSFSK